MGLALDLRDSTHELHTRAERSPLVMSLLRGELSIAGYARLLRNLQAIYSALEDGLRLNADHPALAPLLDPHLPRSAAISADLQALGESADGPLAAAARDYQERLQRLAREAPERLAGHAYVRYLGDLSGGQVMRRQVDRIAGPPEGRATAFYRFGTADTRQLAARFRRGLDSLPLDATAAADVVEEACWAFEQHARLFAELSVAAEADGPAVPARRR